MSLENYWNTNIRVNWKKREVNNQIMEMFETNILEVV